MPNTPPPTDPPAPGTALLALRAELDRVDDAIHDLLMERGRIVERVGMLGAKGRVPLRPGREADIIRRLVARHTGALPARVLARIWRELLAATTAMQGSYVIAVCETDPDGGFVTCAREHFGALTRLHTHRTAAQAIGDVSAGRAIAAVLPIPAEDEPQAAAWWTALLHHDEPRIHVVARLPFWASRPDGASRTQALVVSAAAPDASQHDRSLVGLELSSETSRARLVSLLQAAGLPVLQILLRRGQVVHALVELDGLLQESDIRLTALPGLLRPPVVLGGYAVPIEGDQE